MSGIADLTDRPEAGPSARDLAGLSGREIAPPGGDALYRHAALLAGLAPGRELLVAGCGTGAGLRFLVETFAVHGSGVDPDPHAVERAEIRARESGLTERLHVQTAPMDALPYRDGIFDVCIGDLGLTAGARPDAAVRELARVTRAGGTAILIQLAWTSPVPDARRARIEQHLGVRPLTQVEWKRTLASAGFAGVHADDWSEGGTALRQAPVEPLPDLVARLSFKERFDVSRRAWKRWGLRGALGAWGEGSRLHRILGRDRLLSLVVVKGTRTAANLSEIESPGTVARMSPPSGPSHEPSDVSDLPLFGVAAREAR